MKLSPCHNYRGTGAIIVTHWIAALSVSILAGWLSGRGKVPTSSHEDIAARINELAAPANITSEESAESYVSVLASQWQMGGSTYADVKQRLARAELAAIQDSRRRVSADLVAEAFNRLMLELGAPESMHISGSEVRRFRYNYAQLPARAFIYPNMFARAADGTLSPDCRPVEALFLLYILQYGPNPEAAQGDMSSNNPGRRISSQHPQAMLASGRETEYRTALDTYFRSHSIAHFLAAADHILTSIGLLPEERETKYH
jgi:hypothetical protein